MNKTTTFESDLLKLIFKNVAMALVGDASGIQPSAGAGSLYISIHTADPGEAGNQSTNEANFGAYTRVGVTRGAGWTVTDGTDDSSDDTRVQNAALIQFAVASGGSNTITHFGIGCSPSGNGKLLYSGALSSSIPVSAGIRVEIEAGQLTVKER